MTRRQIVLCGLGGQGIVFATKVLSRAAGLEGLEVLCSEFKGMAQRRASIVSYVKIGDFEGPSVRRGDADVAVCLDAVEAPNAVSFVKPGGACVVNGARAAPDVEDAARRDGIRLVLVDAGADRTSNVTLLAAAAVLPAAAVRRAVEELSPPKAREANLAAFDKGCHEAVRVP